MQTFFRQFLNYFLTYFIFFRIQRETPRTYGGPVLSSRPQPQVIHEDDEGAQLESVSNVHRTNLSSQRRRVVEQGYTPEGEFVIRYDDGTVDYLDDAFPGNQLAIYDMDGKPVRGSSKPNLPTVAEERGRWPESQVHPFDVEEQEEVSSQGGAKRAAPDEVDSIQSTSVAVVENEAKRVRRELPQADVEERLSAPIAPSDKIVQTLTAIAANCNNTATKPEWVRNEDEKREVIEMGSFTFSNAVSKPVCDKELVWSFGDENKFAKVLLTTNTTFKVRKITVFSFVLATFILLKLQGCKGVLEC